MAPPPPKQRAEAAAATAATAYEPAGQEPRPPLRYPLYKTLPKPALRMRYPRRPVLKFGKWEILRQALSSAQVELIFSRGPSGKYSVCTRKLHARSLYPISNQT
eukprot:COSAG06_NODE_189_length_20763_cov_8.677376_8_plen_104_part_00